MSEWSYREAAGGIPESAREPSPVYPAGRVGTPADPNIPQGGGPSLTGGIYQIWRVFDLTLLGSSLATREALSITSS